MKKLNFLLILAMGLALAACGDDGGTAPVDGDDAGGSDDTDGGDGADVDEEAGGGDVTGGDTEGSGDVVDPPEDEICDDGIDNDDDDAIDCDDSDCAATDACVETDCEDGEDNDGDGFIDCDDLADCDCPAEECGPGTVSIGGGCPVIVDPMDYAFSDTFSYINAMAIPPRGTDAECCFDFNGDGGIDNGIAMLLGAVGAIAGEFDIQEALDSALADDSVALLLEWKNWPDSPEFSVFLGTNDVDGVDGPDQDFETRAAGDGVFQLDPASFGEAGALVQFNRAALADGELVAGPSEFRLRIPVDAEDFVLDLDLTIEDARIEGPINEIGTGIESVNSEYDIDGDMVEFGGLKLGGVVPLDQIMSILDELMRECTCAGINPDEPVLTYGDDGTAYQLACSQTPVDGVCTEDDGVICENLGMVCSFAPSLPSLGLNDIDTDDNGVGDALSVGLRLSATGAALGDPAITPAE